MKKLQLTITREPDSGGELSPYLDLQVDCSCGGTLKVQMPLIPEFVDGLDFTCAKCGHKYHMVLPIGE